MTKSQARGMFAAYVVSMVLMLGAIMGSWWYLDNYLGEIRNDIRVLSTRMGSLADRLGGLPVKMHDTNEYLRGSKAQSAPKNTSASDLTPVSPTPVSPTPISP